MGRRRNRGRRTHGNRPSHVWVAVVSAGDEACVDVTPLEEAQERAEEILREHPELNSLVVNESMNGIHAQVTDIWACYRPTRPVQSPSAYVAGVYARWHKTSTARFQDCRRRILDEGRSV